MKTEGIEINACEILRRCLEDVPAIGRVQAVPVCEELRPDFVLEAETHGESSFLVVEVKTKGQPRLAREAINQLHRYQDLFARTYLVFMAPYISARAAEICRQEGVGYADFAGNCYLNFDGIYIHTEGKPNPFPEKRHLRSLYSRKATRILRVLLSAPATTWTLSALAAEAHVSQGHAYKVKELLADREWISTGPDGIALQEPEALLAEWAANFEYKRQDRRDLYSSLAISEIESKITRLCTQGGIGHALTGFSGAERVAPFTRYQRVHAYVQHDISALAEALGLKEVSSGANVCLLTPYDEGVFYGMTEIRGSNVVAPVQLYLDLRGIGGRGEDGAEFLLEEVIRSRW